MQDQILFIKVKIYKRKSIINGRGKISTFQVSSSAWRPKLKFDFKKS